MQSEGAGASPQRARYYAGVVDTAHFHKATDYRSLFDSYVIFITQDDVLGEGRPIYHIRRKIEESGGSFNDGSHIIYVNGSCRCGQTALSLLMHDFFCTSASDMHYKLLKERVKYFKETEEGVQTMCKIMEELKESGRQEGFAEGKNEATMSIAKNLKKLGNMTDETIALATQLTLEQVKAINV